jgi:DHA2 family multidrug resistance protein
VIAFDTAFNAVALLFVVAAPVLVAIKIGLSRQAKSRAAREPLKLIAGPSRQAPALCEDSCKAGEAKGAAPVNDAAGSLGAVM